MTADYPNIHFHSPPLPSVIGFGYETAIAVTGMGLMRQRVFLSHARQQHGFQVSVEPSVGGRDRKIALSLAALASCRRRQEPSDITGISPNPSASGRIPKHLQISVWKKGRSLQLPMPFGPGGPESTKRAKYPDASRFGNSVGGNILNFTNTSTDETLRPRSHSTS